jgi:5-methylcytosine-specific restriction endonuclease McrA
MQRFTPSHLPDHALLPALADVCSRDRATTAEMLGLIAEIDWRRAYLRADHTSMFAYCVRELRMSEDMAAKRIHAARAAREVPKVFEMVADGRLSLSAAWLLAPKLTPANADDLLPAATHKTNDEIRLLLAERFPQEDAPTRVMALVPMPVASAATTAGEPTPMTPQQRPSASDAGLPLTTADPSGTSEACEKKSQHAVRHVAPSECAQVPGSMVPVSTFTRVTPLSPTSFKYEVTLSKAAHHKLEYAKSLLGHAVPSGNLPEIIERALDALIEKLEQSKLGKCSRTRPVARRKPSKPREQNERYISPQVRQAVWKRDGGRCTYVGTRHRRCEARSRLEFDHILTIARGGLSTVENLRLRCRRHNQLEAERTYGVAFMKGKRERARARTDSLQNHSAVTPGT